MELILQIIVFLILLSIVVWGLILLERKYGILTLLTKNYTKYVDEENAKMRAVARQRNQEAQFIYACNWLPIIISIFHQSLCDCGEAIGARVPNDTYALAGEMPVLINSNGLTEFRLRFKYKKGLSMTASEMERYLQYELDRGCFHHGLNRMKIRTTLRPDVSEAIVQIMWLDDLTRNVVI